jgi:hypothetical protein
MAEHSLYASDISAIGEKVGGEAVAKGMRVDILDDTGFECVVFDNTLDRTGSESQILIT